MHIFKKERKHSKRHYKNYKKSTPNNKQGKSICASISLPAPTVNDIEKKTFFQSKHYNTKVWYIMIYCVFVYHI